MRGLSEAYGSWKIICIRRRNGRIAACDACEMSWPSNAMRPAVGSSSRITSRASVDLPQPDSPTSPTVSPRKHLQIHAIDRAQHAVRLQKILARQLEMLDQALHVQQRRRRGCRAHRGGGPGAQAAADAAAAPPCVTQQRALRPAPIGSSAGCSRAGIDRERAARAEAAALGPGARRRAAGPRSSPGGGRRPRRPCRGAACSSAQV